MSPADRATPRKKKAKKSKPTRTASSELPARRFPLASLLHPLRSSTSQWLTIPILLLVGFLLRWAIGLGPYSGYAQPPMHGDFEAQRHWMEVTTQLPVREWYWHDLEWWGLDYPPLTAYHSWFIGIVGNVVEPVWFALYSSRGNDNPGLKTFMRASVIVSEYATYIPAVIMFVRISGKLAGTSSYDRTVAMAVLLLQPTLLLIDHGHFQYNTVMFGLAFAALDCFMSDHLLWGSCFFVLSLGFKQMALYYAPAIFAYLLGLCVFPRPDISRFVKLGVVVLATFTLLLAPLVILGGAPQLAQCVYRVFPFARGLWEDKVANFWCATNVVIKYREHFSNAALQRLSLLATLIAIAPACGILFAYPQKRLLPLGVASCAWGFFLFSFQVHEKTVLLPLVPMTAYLAQSLDSENVAWITWANNVAMFSLWPLLKKDGQGLQYTVMFLTYAWLMGTFTYLPKHWLASVIHVGTYLGLLCIHGCEYFVGQVERYPDLWVVGNVLLCFPAYGIAWLWTLWRLWSEVTVAKPKVE